MNNKKRIILINIFLLLIIGNQCAVFSQKGSESTQKPRQDSKKATTKPGEKQDSRTGSEKSDTKKNASPITTPPSQKDKTTDIAETSKITTGNADDEKFSEHEERIAGIEKKLKALTETNFSWFQWALIGLAGLLILVVIGGGTFFLLRNKKREQDEIAHNFDKLRKAYRRSEQEIDQLKKVLTDLSSQFARQKTEINRLSQSSSGQPTIAKTPSPIFYEEPSAEPEAQFPAAVDDYLAKVKRGAIPVKYDYKERMLVQDAERDGGLLVVRDDSTIDGYLYLIPSFGFFQTKSDYTNYFERYFACAKPMGGTVWIRQPATVNQVNGGWQLDRQGELEVR